MAFSEAFVSTQQCMIFVVCVKWLFCAECLKHILEQRKIVTAFFDAFVIFTKLCCCLKF